MLDNSPSKFRRQGREAFAISRKPEEFCPYDAKGWTGRQKHWVDGWHQAESVYTIKLLKGGSDMKDNLINIADVTLDGTMQSPEFCLRQCLNERIGKQGAFKDGKKLIVIALDDADEGYDISWGQAGMKSSEMLSLLDIFMSEIRYQMGY